MTQNEKLAELSAAGVSVWLDDLSRDLISSGDLAELISTKSVVGVTTNPSIFQAALADGDAYTEQLGRLAAEGKDVDEVVFALTTDDVREACDLFAPIFEATDGVDGRVSLEVDPRLAHDPEATATPTPPPTRSSRSASPPWPDRRDGRRSAPSNLVASPPAQCGMGHAESMS